MLDLIPFRKTTTPDLFREFEEMARHFWSDLPFREITTGGEVAWTPRLDIVETDAGLEVKTELPGLERKDIDISIDRDLLTIKGEKKHEKEEKDRHFHRVERRYGSFYRSVRLPIEVETEKIEATFKDGVLTVNLPRTEGDKKKVKHIDIH